MQGSRFPHSPVPTALAACLALTASACTSPGEPSVREMPALVVQQEQDPPRVEATTPGTPMGDLRVPQQPEEPTSWPAEGLWVGARFTETGQRGDWNGSFVEQRPTDVILGPDLGNDEGYGFSISYRWTSWEAVLSYDNTEYTGSFPGSGLPHDTEIENLDLNLLKYYWVSSPLQPYFIAGIGWSRATIQNGSTDTDLNFVDVSSAELMDGVNFNLGTGIAFYPLPWVSVYAQGMYRFVEYYSNRGLAGSSSGRFDGDNWTAAVGTSIRLLPARKHGLR